MIIRSFALSSPRHTIFNANVKTVSLNQSTFVG